MVPPATIQLGLNGVLSKKDLFRALICSIAVYHESNSAAEHYLHGMLNNSDSSITFDKVYMTDREREQNFLVAYAKDAIFIAFKGSNTLTEIGADLMIDPHSKSGGSFHRGFFKRATFFMGLPALLNPLDHLIDTGKRIIFCGHSFGGAVAHTVLLRFWLENDDLPTEVSNCPDSLISITFGAPHICDAHIAQQVNSNENLKWRFVNFVNQSDPVPRMLHNLKSTPAAELRDCLGETDDIFKSIGGFSGDCTENDYMGAFGAATGSQARKFDYLVLSEKSAPSLNPKEPKFHPVGQYIHLHEDKEHRWVAEQYSGSDHRMWEFLKRYRIHITKLDLEYHKESSYSKVLRASAFIDENEDHAFSSPRIELNVTTPIPEVTFAKWAVNEYLTERSIIIKGKNLLFLSQPVTVTGSKGLRPWMVSMQTDNELRILNPYRTDPMQKSSGSNFALPVIVIETAFGRTFCKSIHKMSYSDKEPGVGVPQKIAKIVQTYIMKATLPFKLDIQTHQLVKSELDGILLCAPSLRPKHPTSRLLSQCLEKLMEYSHNDQSGQIENVSLEINSMVRILVDYLSSMLEVTYVSRDSQIILKAAVGAAVIGAAVIIPAGFLVDGLTLGVTSLALQRLGDKWKPKQLGDYTEVLKAAIRETSAWSPTADQIYKDDELNGIEEAGVLEEILHRQVTKSSSEFKALVKEAHAKDSASLPGFKSDLFRNAESESRLSLLRRIKVVHGVWSLYNLAEVENTHVLGVYGAEDAGKSTFIKKVLEKYNRSSKTPETGVDTHTTAMQPYEVNKSLWLVDFPGSDTVETYADNWEQFTALSSSSILLLDYEGDIKREYQVLYQKMKSMFGSHAQVTIVMNKVDEVFLSTDPSERSQTFTREYFEDQRTKIEAKLGCAGDDKVYLACVHPAVLEDFEELKSLGVLGFEDLVTRLISPNL